MPHSLTRCVTCLSVEEEENTSEEFTTATSENATVPWKLACNQDVPDGKLVSINKGIMKRCRKANMLIYSGLIV